MKHPVAGSPVRVILPVSVLSHAGRVLATDPKLTLVNSSPEPQECIAVAQELAPCILVVSPAALTPQHSILMSLSSIGVRVLMVDEAADETKVKEYLRKGYCGVLQGSENLRIIRKALDVVARGEIWAGRRVMSELIRELAIAGKPRNLTPREGEILALIAQGYNNREIAQRLFVTRETVRWHVRSLHSKLGVEDRARLMTLAKKPDADLEQDDSS